MWKQLRNYVDDFREQLPTYQEQMMGKINQHISNWRNGETTSGEELMISGMKIRIVKKIADGGYSSVFLAEEVKEWNEQEGGAMTKGQQFALKKVICGGNEQLEEAEKEIRVMKSLEHKHLLPIKGYLVQESGVVYMLFDLYDGNVWDVVQWRIKSHVALTRDEVLQVFTQLCLALEAMHMNPVEPLCHRDVKPHNILLKTPLDGPDMSSQSRWRDLTKTEAVLMDFGSVKPATCCISSRSQALQTQEDAERYTTAPYRAPELWDVSSDSTIDAKVDVWAAGCILYYLIVGETPFERTANEAGGSLMLSILNGAYSWPEGTLADVYPDLRELVQYCLITDPQKRPNIMQVLERIQFKREQQGSKREDADPWAELAMETRRSTQLPEPQQRQDQGMNLIDL